MADFNKPATTDTYANVLAYIKATIADLALHLDPATTTPTNVPTNAVGWNSANNRFEKYNGTTWAALSTTYAFQDITAAGNVTLSGGTANGLAYLNASKQIVTGSALTFDGTALGVGSGTANPLGFGKVAAVNDAGSPAFALNVNGTATADFVATTTVTYLSTRTATPISFQINGSEQMRLTSTGLGIGTSSPGSKLDVQTSGVGIQLKQNATGSATYYVMDNTIETGGKRWRFGYTGAAGLSTFSLYNATDNVTAWVADSSGNLGLGVTPSAWATIKAMQVTSSAFVGGDDAALYIGNRTYYNGGWKYGITGGAVSYYQQYLGNHFWFTAPSGTAGNAITFTQAMTLDASGNLVLGATSGSGRLHVVDANKVFDGFGNINVLTSDAATVGYGGAIAFGGGNATGGTSPYVFAKIQGIKETDTVSWRGALVFGTTASSSAVVERARIDSAGQFGLGVTPQTWYTDRRVLQIGSASALYNTTDANGSATGLGNNFYVDAANAFRYLAAGKATVYAQTYTGNHLWGTSVSGSAGGALTIIQAMTLFASGGLSLGNTTDPGATNLSVQGTISAGGTLVMPAVLATAQGATSGTARDFTGIPSWVKKITVMFQAVSTNGASNMIVQLGYGATPTYATGGYQGGMSYGNNAIVTGAMSSGFDCSYMGSTNAAVSGQVVLTLLTGATWTMSGIIHHHDTTTFSFSAGSVSLGGALTAVRITTVGGTNTFDAGNVNILYE